VNLIATALLVGVSSIFVCASHAAQAFEVEEVTIASIHQAPSDKSLTCVALVQTYLDRIHAYDHKGPSLNSILTLNPNALAEADELDAQYARAGLTGPLHCIPMLLKDNYNTADMPTTGGSAALAGSQPRADAFVVAKLHRAGAIILGKSNMHEFALSGTTASSLGGQTLNPYDLTRTPVFGRPRAS
jgi:amidase